MASSESRICVRVLELGSDVGNRHVTRTPAMSDPAEDVPANRPVRWGDRGLQFGALRLGVAGTGPIRAVVQLADQLHRAFEGVKAAVSVVADMHPASTDRTGAVENVEFPVREIGILGPLVRHRADLPVLVMSVDGEGTATGYVRKRLRSSPLSGHCFCRSCSSGRRTAVDAGGPRALGEYLKDMADDGYLFAFQDIRGRYKSEGTFVMIRPRGTRVTRSPSTRGPTRTTRSTG